VRYRDDHEKEISAKTYQHAQENFTLGAGVSANLDGKS
jgi:hypothetical protein